MDAELFAEYQKAFDEIVQNGELTINEMVDYTLALKSFGDVIKKLLIIITKILFIFR